MSQLNPVRDPKWNEEFFKLLVISFNQRITPDCSGSIECWDGRLRLPEGLQA